MVERRGYRGLVTLIISGILELAGIAAIVWGFALISPIAGFIVGGLALILLGMFVDPPKVRPQQPKQIEEVE